MVGINIRRYTEFSGSLTNTQQIKDAITMLPVTDQILMSCACMCTYSTAIELQTDVDV